MRHAEPVTAPFEIRLMNLITRVLLGVLLIGGCLGSFLWFISQPRFDIKAVEIHGEGELRHVSMQQLRQVAVDSVKGNFFTVDLKEVKTMFEATPWVRQATVSRVWPYTLKITVQEYIPVALYGENKQTLKALSTQGEVFNLQSEEFIDTSLPLLDAPSEKFVKEMWAFYMLISNQLEPLGEHIEVLRLSEHGIWSMDLKSGVQVIIGRGEQEALLKRVQRFLATWAVTMKPYMQRRLLRVDLRYENAYAIEVEGVEVQRATTGRIR